MTKIRVNAFSEPNAAVFHPNDWQDIRLLRTADGIYIWGNPADAGPERIWGLTVVQTHGPDREHRPRRATSSRRSSSCGRGSRCRSVTTRTTSTKNKQTVRAEMRAALAVYRPAAFATVTGI